MLDEFPNHSFKDKPAQEEEKSWEISIPFLKEILKDVNSSTDVNIFIEYEMPLLSYQRADCIITIGNKIIVLEFKNYNHIRKATINKHIEQLEAYTDILKRSLDESKVNPNSQINGYLIYTNNKMIVDEDKESIINEEIIFSDKEKIKTKIECALKEVESEDTNAYNNLKNREFKSKLISDLCNPTIRHHQMELHKNEKLLFDHNMKSKRRNVLIVDGSPGSGKTLLAFQSLKKNLKFLKEEVYYITSSEHMKNFLEEEDLIYPYKKGTIIKHFSDINSDTKAKLLICDEVQNTSENKIKEILDNTKIKNIIFFLDMKQKTKEENLAKLDNLIKEIKKSDLKIEIKRIDLNESNRFQNCRNDHLHLIDEFLFNEERYLNIYKDISKMMDILKIKLNVGYSVRVVGSYLKKDKENNVNINGVKFLIHKNSFKEEGDLTVTAYEYSHNNKNTFIISDNGEEKYCLGLPLTVQGFEYDYVGIIFGEDITFSKNGGWNISERDVNKMEMIKNRYRVLLTRARKGCYVYFMHDETREYFEEVFNIKAQ